jgi:hypothetical protein
VKDKKWVKSGPGSLRSLASQLTELKGLIEVQAAAEAEKAEKLVKESVKQHG